MANQPSSGPSLTKPRVVQQIRQLSPIVTVSNDLRFLNATIDLFVLFVLFYVTNYLLLFTSLPIIFYESSIDFFYTYAVVYFLYYFSCDYYWQQTVGKLVTKTKTVNIWGEKPTFKEVLIRTVSRFIPLEALSFFSKNNVGWHDKISKTRVIRK